MQVHLVPIFEDNYVFVLQQNNSQDAVAVDPGSAPEVLTFLKKENLKLKQIWLTHHHQDHIGGLVELQQATGTVVYAAAADHRRIPLVQKTLNDGNEFQALGEKVLVQSLDGHTRGHIGFWLPNSEIYFCGDTLFVMGCGRLFEGTAKEMGASLQKIRSLPPNTKLYCTHEYTETNLRFALEIEPGNSALKKRKKEILAVRKHQQPTVPTTVAEEIATNPFLRWDSAEIQKNTHSEGREFWEIFGATRQAKDEWDRQH